MNRRGFLQLTRGAMAMSAITMLDRKNAAIAQTYSKATRGLISVGRGVLASVHEIELVYAQL